MNFYFIIFLFSQPLALFMWHAQLIRVGGGYMDTHIIFLFTKKSDKYKYAHKQISGYIK